MRNFLD